MIKFSLITVATLLVATHSAAASGQEVQYVELSDANQASLKLELSKSLRGVQEALQGQFSFQSVQEAQKFLDQCELVKAQMAGADDSAFNGLAKQIKALLAQPDLAQACAITSHQLDQFAELDTAFSAQEHDYLSASKLEKLVKFNQELEANPSVKLVLGTPFVQVVNQLGEALLKEAANDFEIFAGEQEPKRGMFDFDTRYKRACAIGALLPICKLARRSQFDTVSAVGADLADLASQLANGGGGQQQVAAHEQASGVKVSEAKAACESVEQSQAFRPMKQLDGYLAAGFLTEDQVRAEKSSNSQLDLYHELYHLCKVLA